ncbi:LacI family DNA-binding transcriptional regulator [Streptomyces fuscichromogenes]|uniref:LacI family transcriptional regulator n=1 Tax=Streptomyces fuscichromogenes TaxID=1324013 RepID=A0A917XCR3_9ACTN|nr:LacI family DNA-binding transcriptional regulator [Streptomyces fuscichromogenes]GGN10453.1 LacI family transcriptional regulator [Streptomyces fuscichromogenes]
MAPPERRRRSTQRDIARRAGVSRATVSLVIGGGAASARIAEPTRRAVPAAAEVPGCAADVAARGLKGGRNRPLGLHTFESVFPTDLRDFSCPFLLGVEEQTARQGYDLMLFCSDGSAPGTAGTERSIHAGGTNLLKIADGCVLLGGNVRREELSALVREGFPFVLVRRREVDDGELSYVAADVSGTAGLVAEPARLGHPCILYLRVPEDTEPTRDRALLVEPTEDNRFTEAPVTTAGTERVRFPEDCSPALLGDPPSWTPEFRNRTRLSPPRAETAGDAVRVLVELLDQETPEPRQPTVPCAFVPGDSVGSVPTPGGRPPT